MTKSWQSADAAAATSATATAPSAAAAAPAPPSSGGEQQAPAQPFVGFHLLRVETPASQLRINGRADRVYAKRR